MSKSVTPFEESPRSIVYAMYLDCCDRINTLPGKRAFWVNVLNAIDPETGKSPANELGISEASYRYYWDQLRYVDNLIEIVDPGGLHSVRLVERKLTPVEPLKQTR